MKSYKSCDITLSK